MQITACKHKNRKHYAKVSLYCLSFYRTCVPVVTESTAETSMPTTVSTKPDFFTLWVCAKPVISKTITKYSTNILINL